MANSVIHNDPDTSAQAGKNAAAVYLISPASGLAVEPSSGGGGGGGAVTAASGSYVDGAIVTLGTEADTAWGGSGSATLIALTKALYTLLTTGNTNTGALGTQTTLAAAKADLDTIAGTISAGKALVQQQASASVSGTLQSAATAAGNGTPLNVLGMSACAFTVTGTYTGLTVNWEGSEDGTNYSALSATQLGTTTIGTTTAAVGTYECSVGGLQLVRARLTASSPTGNITVTAHAVPVNFAPRNINANQVGTWSTQIQGTPDAGSTFKTIKTATDGTMAGNATLQPGTNFAGYVGTAREGVAAGTLGTQRILTSNKTLTTGLQTLTLTDQFGTTYTASPSAKQLYVSSIDATCDPGTTAGTPQTALFQLFNNNTGNILHQHEVTNGAPMRSFPMPLVLAANTAVLAKIGASNLGTPVGSMFLTIHCYEL